MKQNRRAILIAFLAIGLASYAQEDTSKRTSDSFFIRQKGLLGHLAQTLRSDSSTALTVKGVERNDEPFRQYRGRIIRNISIATLDFGVPISDTSKKINNDLTRVANKLHHKSRHYVIRNNLFFRENDRLLPFLMGDNERHLRNLPFLQDAMIKVIPVKDSKDSVDVLVLTKDVLSIGVSFTMHNNTSAEIKLKEDNHWGWGDRIQFQTLYDKKRRTNFSTGFEYIDRNIAGTFIDGYAGFLNFNKAFSSGNYEEYTNYVSFIRPLVNPYMRWTYSLEASTHNTKNMYSGDSLYQYNFKYKYYVIDGWVGWNMSADKLVAKNEDNRLRRVLSMRFLNQTFSNKPITPKQYFYWYEDVTAVLGAVSIFQQNSYRTQYIYGFGRNEDVPEGIDISLVGGWTIKNKRERPYSGLEFHRFYFDSRQRYFDYTAKVGSYFYHGKSEDINLLFNVDFFDRLRDWGAWKQRTFISAGIGRQYHSLLNQPLMLESDYGLPGFNYNNLGGVQRISAKLESVFFSPWSLLFFKFAPFVFGDASLFKLNYDHSSENKLFSSIGGGVRTRNESLIFGTMELKGYYFPKRSFFGEQYRIEVNTNLRFKYNSPIIRKPDFVAVN